jgi:hypothetical protein
LNGRELAEIFLQLRVGALTNVISFNLAGYL